MNSKLYKDVDLSEVYLVRAEEPGETYKDSYGYTRRSPDYSVIIYKGIPILDQIPQNFSTHVDVKPIKNSIKNVVIEGFQNTSYSGSNIVLDIKLILEDGDVHKLSCDEYSMSALLSEVEIKEGIILSECSFIPSGHNRLVYTKGNNYKEFLTLIKASEETRALKFSELKTGDIYNLKRVWRDKSLYIGDTYRISLNNMCSSEFDSSKLTKKKVFIHYADSDFKDVIKIIKTKNQKEVDNNGAWSAWENHIENSPTINISQNPSKFPNVKELKELNFNKILEYGLGLNRTWAWNVNLVFKSRADAKKFHTSNVLNSTITNDLLLAHYKTHYFNTTNVINYT